MNPISNAERFDEVDARIDQLSAKVRYRVVYPYPAANSHHLKIG